MIKTKKQIKKTITAPGHINEVELTSLSIDLTRTKSLGGVLLTGYLIDNYNRQKKEEITLLSR